MVIFQMMITVHVKYAKTDTGLGQIPTDSHFDGSQTVIGKGIGSGDDRENIDSGG